MLGSRSLPGFLAGKHCTGNHPLLFSVLSELRIQRFLNDNYGGGGVIPENIKLKFSKANNEPKNLRVHRIICEPSSTVMYNSERLLGEENMG